MGQRSHEGKVVLITGGASGIGAATARALLDSGAQVMITDRNAGAAAEMATHLGLGSASFAADLRSADAATAAVAATVERFGRLNVVFNNAGLGFNGPLTDHDDEVIDDLIAVNLRATVMVCRAAIPHLLANTTGGVIVNNASNGGVIGRALDPVYCATKHAVVGLSKSLALAHAHQGLRVNAVCPGPIDTPMLWGNFEGVPREDAARRILATCPDPRIAAAGEVAAAVVYLTSDVARFVNGVILPIDGAKSAGVMPSDRYRLDFDIAKETVDGVLAEAGQ